MAPDAPAPLVSLIVRTKDRPTLLLRALRSIAAQTYRPIEVVLVNDGGVPLDAAALETALGGVALQHHRLDTNRGRAHAANTGIGLARGRFIGFLDDDDALYPQHVQALVALLESEGCAVAYADVEMVTQALAEDGQGFVDVHTSVFDTDFSYAHLLVSNFIPFNAVLFEAEVLRAANGLDESFELYEDWDLLIRVATQHRFTHLRQVTARYHQWSDVQQINRSNADRMAAATQRILAKHHALLTPELVLQYRSLRDAHDAELREAIARGAKHAGALETRLASLDATLAQRDGQLAQREHELAQRDLALAQRDQRIAHAEALAAERGERAQRFEVLANERDERIHQLDGDLRMAHAQFQGELQERSRQIALLTAEINGMRATLGWRALERWRRVRDRALPAGSAQRRVLDLGLRTVLVIRHEGWRSAARKAARKLARMRERATQLSRAAGTVYRHQGARAVVARMRAYLGRRRQVPQPAAATASGSAAAPQRHTSKRYLSWLRRHEAGGSATVPQVLESLQRRPLISIITPVYNVDPKWLDRCVESVLAQHYPHWELCLHDDASPREDTRQTLQRWAASDPRISVSMGAANQGISGASNVALARARGEFIALLDHDDELAADALLEVARLLDAHPDTDLVYSDEDRISEGADGGTVRHDPFFKPEWSPRLLFACMYTGHLSVYRKAVVDEAGGFRSQFDFSQDYDLALRVTERTDRIRHLPKVLYHWRTLPESAAGGGKDYARISNIAALQAACDRRGYRAKALALPHANRVVFEPAGAAARVSIIVPTDSRKNVFHCVELLLRHTDYPAFEILVVTNSALAAEVLAQHPDDPRVGVVRYDEPFNFSRKCNVGAAAASGEYVLFYNDDVEAIDGSWLRDMVNAFGAGGVGAVSPRLFYENDTIQYAGMITNVRGMIGTAFHTVHKDSGTYFNFVQSEREVSLASGACLLMPKRVFDEVGGFDAERTPIMHSDADLSFRIREHGYSIIYTPYAALRHIGHLSLKESDGERERRKDKADLYLLKCWGDYLSRDPYHPVNMTELLYHRGDVPYHMRAGRQEPELVHGKDLLLVSHDLTLSGAPILLVYLAEHFRARGYFVTVMSPLDGELANTLRERNIPVIVDATLADADPDPLTIKLMAAFDLIGANTIAAWPAVLAAQQSDTPVLWVLHESHDGRRLVDEQPRVAQALAAAEDVVFACDFTRSLYQPFDRAGNFRVMPYGARPLQAEPVARPDPQRVRIVHIGSVERRKGQDIFLDALARLPAACRAMLDVVMIGRPLRPEFLEGIRPKLQALPFVSYLGQVPHAQIAGHVAAADIFVSSSRDEVFPVTILEAMSLGKPVIATAVGGVPEMLREGVDGLVVPAEDSAALAAAIERLVDGAERRQAMGCAARQRFFECFTIDRLGDRLLEIVAQRV
jgi:glycosyltransferase involved in cell wall biosynthesis